MVVDCFTCAYADRDKHGRYLDRCAGYGNCSYDEYEGKVKSWPIDQMKELLAGAVMSKFVSIEACRCYRDAIQQCIAIMEEEEQSNADYV